ncbi:hypothetical protein ACFQFQ_07365 [Sulfitobacter porphyrae]|uniref:Uncharacterized protein n=1 Tax=Sulfitobacter porphyrae TaxID=1246864 RepID=A0ABW2B145_9RHOB
MLSFIGISYGNLSRGLAARTPDGPSYCNELLSSGGDDSAMVSAFSLFFIPLIVRLYRFVHEISAVEVWLFVGAIVVSVLALFLATLDCAQVLYTAFGIPDLYLASVLVALPLSAFMLWKNRLGA